MPSRADSFDGRLDIYGRRYVSPDFVELRHQCIQIGSLARMPGRMQDKIMLVVDQFLAAGQARQRIDHIVKFGPAGGGGIEKRIALSVVRISPL